jgi:hypothetical protein
MAKLGGVIGRKDDGEPGTISLWRGIQRLDDITETFTIHLNYHDSSTVSDCVQYGQYVRG